MLSLIYVTKHINAYPSKDKKTFIDRQ